MPELRAKYKELRELALKNPDVNDIFERECRLNGLPTTGLNSEERIERLVALEEYRVKLLLKEQAKQAKRSSAGESGESSDR